MARPQTKLIRAELERSPKSLVVADQLQQSWSAEQSEQTELFWMGGQELKQSVSDRG